MAMSAETERVIIIGGGLAGVTAFYELAARGRDVVLLDAADDLAQGASFANGAVLHPSLPDPWNSPGIAWPLLRSLFDPSAPMKLHLSQIPSLLGWGRRFLRNADAARHLAITEANYRLADYSTRQTDALTQKLNLQYENSAPGTMKLLRSETDRAQALALAEKLAGAGLVFEELDRAALLAREPLLAQAESVVGALHFPNDRIGNARLFCLALAEAAQKLGGTVRLSSPVTQLSVAQGRVVGVRLKNEELRGLVVLAAGADAARLVKPLRLALPIRPAKGYSLTLPAGDALRPIHPLVDPVLHIAVTPLPGRVRILGMAEFAGFDRRIDKRRGALLRRFFTQLMPEAAAQLDWTGGDLWAGLRPMSADGRPFIGASPIDGLWLNCGHGHLGWTMAVGSAKLLADAMMGQKPEIDAAPFSAARR